MVLLAANIYNKILLIRFRDHVDPVFKKKKKKKKNKPDSVLVEVAHGKSTSSLQELTRV